ncbi:hypothetical protein BK120_23250 [Paenibacillus sp. FSL A5-0031]|uniref:hypothetical protein n=1 Tax=Paenibacillus sp. FSL A5-0031 TaxID=1920420 RepID=UPI00096FADAF|nr:hypothetical protein [Paenibacillus sp. FSL A5-0031]OME78659.1 hypothetical protein BK120_23250 [Paenibacillus sp. FSL A5-0031]
MITTVPRENDQLFFIDKEVIIVKVYLNFQLAKVRYLSTTDTFMVDFHVLQPYVDERSSLSISLLGGVL